MCAARFYASNDTLGVSVQDEILPEEADFLSRIIRSQLSAPGDGMPVPSHQFPHGRALADLGQFLVLFLGKHPLPPGAFRGTTASSLRKAHQGQAREEPGPT